MRLLKFRLDSLMVVGVGAAGHISQYLALGNFANEHHVAAEIYFLQHFAGEHGVGMLCHIQQAVMAAADTGEILEFVHIPAGLHTEMPDRLKGNMLRQNTEIELTGGFDDLPGQITHLHGDGKLCGVISHLEGGIYDTAVVRFSLGSENEQAVA